MENLLKRAFLFLESGEFKKADEYFEKVLDMDCENPRAYLGKLMVERKVRKIEDLANCSKPLEQSKHYEMIMRFGGNQDFKADVRRYNEEIVEMNNSVVTQPIKKTQNSIKKGRKKLFLAIGIGIAALAVVLVVILGVMGGETEQKEKESVADSGNTAEIAPDSMATEGDSKKLYPYREYAKWGYTDENGNIVVDCIYDYASDFSEGFS